MSRSPLKFQCSVCGKYHEGLPTDTAYKLPDEVWALNETERKAKAKYTTDLCQLGSKYFIRCLLQIPFIEQSGYYGWGIWCQVEWPVFQRYLDLYEVDATNEPRVPGTVANAIQEYGNTLGLPVEIQFQLSTQRPAVHFASDQKHALAQEARGGISAARYHEILISRGNLPRP